MTRYAKIWSMKTCKKIKKKKQTFKSQTPSLPVSKSYIIPSIIPYCR